jgi:hypothetical protein
MQRPPAFGVLVHLAALEQAVHRRLCLLAGLPNAAHPVMIRLS